MIEWEFSEAEMPGLPPEPPRRRLLPRRWRWMALALLAVALLGGGGWLWWTAQARERDLHGDIAAAVREEQRALNFHQEERATDLVSRTASESWRRAYRAALQGRPPFSGFTADEMRVRDFEFREDAALVSLVLTATVGSERHSYEQVRFYRHEGDQWLRAPLPPEWWGTTYRLRGENFVITYQERDIAFAEALLPALERLRRNTIATWRVVNLPAAPIEIEIAPRDLSGPLFLQDGLRQIVVNSPVVVPPQPPLTNEEQVRLVLGEVLVQAMTWPSEVRLLERRPNGHLFLDALRRAQARAWMLDDGARAALRAAWRTDLEGTWVSPMQSSAAQLRADAWPTIEHRRAIVATDLMAEYIGAAYSSDALGTLAQALSRPLTWDQLMRQTLGPGALDLELAARAYALGPSDEALRPPHTPTTQAGPHRFPLEGTITEVTSSGAPLVLRVQTASDPAPIQVWLNAPERLVDGQLHPVAASCLQPGGRVRVEGDWVELGVRIHASRITLLDTPAALAVRSVPSDTVALLVGTLGTTPQALAALRSDGRLEPLLGLSRVSSLLAAPGPAPLIAFVTANDPCSSSTNVLTVAALDGRGSARAPLGSGEIAGMAWGPENATMLTALGGDTPQRTGRRFVETRLDLESGAALTDAASTLSRAVLPPDLPRLGTPLGWSSAHEAWIFRSTQRGAVVAVLVAPDLGEARSIALPDRAPGVMRLDPQGRWLAYLSRHDGHRPADEADSVSLAPLDGEPARLLVSAPAGCQFDGLTWATSQAQARLAVVRTCTLNGGAARSDILVLDAGMPGLLVLAVAGEAGSTLSQPLWCPDGSLLMLRHDSSGSALIRARAIGQPPETLLRSNRVTPFACPPTPLAARRTGE